VGTVSPILVVPLVPQIQQLPPAVCLLDDSNLSLVGAIIRPDSPRAVQLLLPVDLAVTNSSRFHLGQLQEIRVNDTRLGPQLILLTKKNNLTTVLNRCPLLGAFLLIYFFVLSLQTIFFSMWIPSSVLQAHNLGSDVYFDRECTALKVQHAKSRPASSWLAEDSYYYCTTTTASYCIAPPDQHPSTFSSLWLLTNRHQRITEE